MFAVHWWRDLLEYYRLAHPWTFHGELCIRGIFAIVRRSSRRNECIIRVRLQDDPYTGLRTGNGSLANTQVPYPSAMFETFTIANCREMQKGPTDTYNTSGQILWNVRNLYRETEGQIKSMASELTWILDHIPLPRKLGAPLTGSRQIVSQYYPMWKLTISPVFRLEVCIGVWCPFLAPLMHG